MKAKLGHYVQWLREGFLQMLRLHPVEAGLIALGCIGCLVAYETDSDDTLVRLALVPLAFAVALAFNNLAGPGPWRKVYWVCWAPFVPFAFWGGLEDWLASEPSFITFGILAPLALLLCRRAACNKRFVDDIMVWLRSGILAALFANVALGLFSAILFSTTYIFGLEGSWIEHVWIYALILFETFVGPVLFLMMYDRWAGAECRGTRILDVLLNYIVTPALLIYTAILCLYMVKILVTWSLPEGGVAYLVFGFTLLAIAVKALQPLLQKRMYDWFFDRFSLVSLPTQLLFWIGVLRRTNEYGLTEPRVYLLVCGGLMTLCVLLFLSRRTGRYLYVGLAGFVCFAALAYLPVLEPQRIATSSQVRRAVRVAKQLNMLDGEGRLQLDAFVPDTLLRRDTAAFTRRSTMLPTMIRWPSPGSGWRSAKSARPCRICSAIMWSTATITVPTTTGYRCTRTGCGASTLPKGIGCCMPTFRTIVTTGAAGRITGSRTIRCGSTSARNAPNS